jgi:hypothetical protein
MNAWPAERKGAASARLISGPALSSSCVTPGMLLIETLLPAKGNEVMASVVLETFQPDAPHVPALFGCPIHARSLRMSGLPRMQVIAAQNIVRSRLRDYR